MAFCKNCGEKLEDGTKFCPKCGNSIEVDCNKETTHSSIDNNGNEMTKAQKGGAGCLTVFIAISGLTLLIQGDIIPGIAAIAAVVALVYLQMGKINKKYAWTVMIAAFIGFVVIGAATTEDKPSTKQVKSTQKEATESERQAKQQQEEAERQAKQQQEEAKRQAEAERQAQQQKEESEREASEKEEKVKRVAEMAYKKGYDKRMSTRELINSESCAHLEYTMRYGTEPQDEPSQERWNVFLENYKKGFSDAAKDIMKKINSEEF